MRPARIGGNKFFRPSHVLRNDLRNDLPGDIRQRLVPSLMEIRQQAMIDSQQVKNRGMIVMQAFFLTASKPNSSVAPCFMPPFTLPPANLIEKSYGL